MSSVISHRAVEMSAVHGRWRKRRWWTEHFLVGRHGRHRWPTGLSHVTSRVQLSWLLLWQISLR